MSVRPTEEQIAICASQAQVLKIKAGAGTGKTTTLRGLAARNTRSRMLYLAFNKAIKEDAQGKFGTHVRAMTAHGMAFARVGKNYANTPNKLATSDLKPFHVIPHLAGSLKGVPTTLHNLYGGRVIEAVKAFLVSGDEGIAEQHVAISMAPAEKKHFKPESIIASAQQVWALMQDLASPVPMTHDGYLKEFALGDPDLGYDFILLDEAQDTNPVLQKLISAQGGRLACVGDEHQAIYGFRGATNAMALMPADEEHALTGSFRFGPQIAELANVLLAAKDEPLRLRGLGRPGLVAPLALGQYHAFISRTNSSLFGRAIRAIEQGLPFAFVGPLTTYRLDLIEQTHRLSMGQAPTDPFLKAFENYEDLEEYADALCDREILSRCGLVNKYGKRLPALLAQITAKAGMYPGSNAPPPLILTTAHRAKGLEFDRVQLADDFLDFFDEGTNTWRDLTKGDAQTTEEVNLQYVAITRAKEQLEIGDKLDRYWRHTKAPPARPPVARTLSP